MAEKRVPDPTLMARLQLSAKGVDWAASLVAHKQHEQPGGEWSAHQHLVHLLAVETEVYQPRVMAMLQQGGPVFQPWGAETFMADRYTRQEGDVIELAERFMRERGEARRSLQVTDARGVGSHRDLAGRRGGRCLGGRTCPRPRAGTLHRSALRSPGS